MSRWYAGFRCYGKPDVVIDVVERIILRDNLGGVVPLVRVEKGVDRGQEFYLFLAIEGDEIGEVPDELEPLLDLQMLGERAEGHFSLDDITSMAGPELSVYHYTCHIPYLPPAELSNEDPLGYDGHRVAGTTTDKILERTEQHNRLLAWTSAAGAGRVDLFRHALNAVGLGDRPGEARRILRRLRLLGHLEGSRDGTRWSSTPPVLVRAAHSCNCDRFFLAGQREPALLRAVARVADIENAAQPDGAGPAPIRFTLRNPKAALRELKEATDGHIRYGGNVAEALAEAVPNIVGWMQSLEELQRILPHLFDVRKYNGRQFEPVSFDGATGFYELWPLRAQSRSASAKYTAFYDGRAHRWLRGDWYGLQYLMWLGKGGRCPAIYQPETGHLIMQDAWRLPELYERVLVLASGSLPLHRPPRITYSGVSERVIRVLQGKLLMRVEGLPDDA